MRSKAKMMTWGSKWSRTRTAKFWRFASKRTKNSASLSGGLNEDSKYFISSLRTAPATRCFHSISDWCIYFVAKKKKRKRPSFCHISLSKCPYCECTYEKILASHRSSFFGKARWKVVLSACRTKYWFLLWRKFRDHFKVAIESK